MAYLDTLPPVQICIFLMHIVNKVKEYTKHIWLHFQELLDFVPFIYYMIINKSLSSKLVLSQCLSFGVQKVLHACWVIWKSVQCLICLSMYVLPWCQTLVGAHAVSDNAGMLFQYTHSLSTTKKITKNMFCQQCTEWCGINLLSGVVDIALSGEQSVGGSIPSLTKRC